MTKLLTATFNIKTLAGFVAGVALTFIATAVLALTIEPPFDPYAFADYRPQPKNIWECATLPR